MKHVLVNCKDYNGYKNVLFMMDPEDWRLTKFDRNYQILERGKYTKKYRELITESGKRYVVFADWSVRRSG